MNQLKEATTNLEKHLIRAALEACKWNQTKAAKALGISFRSIRYKIKLYKIT